MKVYTVIKFSDMIHGKEDKTFSSFNKALRYIENELTEIDTIHSFKNGEYWNGRTYEKENWSDVKWAEILLRRNNTQETHYYGKNKFYNYSIKIVEVL